MFERLVHFFHFFHPTQETECTALTLNDEAPTTTQRYSKKQIMFAVMAGVTLLSVGLTLLLYFLKKQSGELPDASFSPTLDPSIQPLLGTLRVLVNGTNMLPPDYYNGTWWTTPGGPGISCETILRHTNITNPTDNLNGLLWISFGLCGIPCNTTRPAAEKNWMQELISAYNMAAHVCRTLQLLCPADNKTTLPVFTVRAHKDQECLPSAPGPCDIKVTGTETCDRCDTEPSGCFSPN